MTSFPEQENKPKNRVQDKIVERANGAADDEWGLAAEEMSSLASARRTSVPVMLLAVIAARAGGPNSHAAVECRSGRRRDTLCWFLRLDFVPQPARIRRRQTYAQFSNSVLLI